MLQRRRGSQGSHGLAVLGHASGSRVDQLDQLLLRLQRLKLRRDLHRLPLRVPRGRDPILAELLQLLRVSNDALQLRPLDGLAKKHQKG